jgi:hypothetical protein
MSTGAMVTGGRKTATTNVTGAEWSAS